MPIPQVNDRIKEAPVVVLRAVFAGIGQILLKADKVRARATEQVWTPERATTPGLAGRPQSPLPQEARNGISHAVTQHSALREATASHATATAESTKIRPATKAPATAKAKPATAKARPAAKTAAPAAKAAKTPTAKAAPTAKASPKTAPTAKATSTAKAKSGPASQASKAQPAAEAPPLPGYDDLSLASLRARLRTFDAPMVQAILAYEKAHARREPVITMLERRLAKISAG